ncbi:hypothetical protein P171DRAFT_113189 [Karstenula rhodostoma CBS 690.94]|uniref:Uncharacterized protein n=1 Tax=Karstenula rhodostoma CBS 690.94 TaxID=1392251 RepID=A0A9P4P9J6_9PLEO|nr:hypothetical protein P171DRAFT_113189 [Karstenula rhodostoma CBS 690.94]
MRTRWPRSGQYGGRPVSRCWLLKSAASDSSSLTCTYFLFGGHVGTAHLFPTERLENANLPSKLLWMSCGRVRIRLLARLPPDLFDPTVGLRRYRRPFGVIGFFRIWFQAPAKCCHKYVGRAFVASHRVSPVEKTCSSIVGRTKATAVFRERWPSRSLSALGDLQASAHSVVRICDSDRQDYIIFSSPSRSSGACEGYSLGHCARESLLSHRNPGKELPSNLLDQRPATSNQQPATNDEGARDVSWLLHAQPPAGLRRAAQVWNVKYRAWVASHRPSSNAAAAGDSCQCQGRCRT